MNTAELSKICRQVRRDIITMTANAGSGHPGGSLSAVELMTSVFYNHMRLDPKNPKWDGRDRFVLSKGPKQIFKTHLVLHKTLKIRG